MYTQHGHHIPGTPVKLPRPTSVARCGGVGLCPTCTKEASPTDLVGDDVDTPMVFVTDNGGHPNQFIDKARSLVVEKYNRDLLDVIATPPITEDEVYVVWFSKTLQNWKALCSTDRTDGRYYELTYDGDKKQTYVDVYKKISKEVIRDADR